MAEIEKADNKNTVDTLSVSDVKAETSVASRRSDQTHRSLKPRHIQLIGIGGVIGTLLFVQIGSSLAKGGPGSLFIAFTCYSTVILAVNNSLSEMVTWIPISSPFVRFADRFVDPALGFCSGVNFLIFQVLVIPFEVVAFDVVLKFWSDKIPTSATICFVLFWYTVINVFAVRWYGEWEFWLALGKVILIVGLIIFTFVTMVGGNPLHDAYGFRYWNPSKVEGAPFATYIKEGGLGRFMGFLACLIQASSTIAGPEYVAMTAGEAIHPRRTLPKAFNTVLYRLAGFFILGSLCAGITRCGLVPYVIAMTHMRIPVLPHIVNALLLTSIFSAGNSYVYCASRTLYGMALEGKAPAFLTKCTKSGVPIYCVSVTLLISLISFLQVSNDSAKVLGWLVSILTASMTLNYAMICFTYLRFYKALKIQGISRDVLPYKTRLQPFSAYYGFVGTLTMALIGGYTVFLPGRWNVADFMFSYVLLGFLPLCFILWKFAHKTKWQELRTMHFFDTERDEIDQMDEK